MTNITLRRHLTEAALDPNLVYLIEDIASSCRVVANTVRNGAFEDNLGSADAINVQGETQKTLDILAMMSLSASARTATALRPWCQKKWRTSPGLKIQRPVIIYFILILWMGRQILM
jgi:hypothetical protein